MMILQYVEKNFQYTLLSLKFVLKTPEILSYKFTESGMINVQKKKKQNKKQLHILKNG